MSQVWRVAESGRIAPKYARVFKVGNQVLMFYVVLPTTGVEAVGDEALEIVVL